MLSTIVEPTDRTDDHATHGHQFDHQSITAHPQCSVIINENIKSKHF